MIDKTNFSSKKIFLKKNQIKKHLKKVFFIRIGGIDFKISPSSFILTKIFQ